MKIVMIYVTDSVDIILAKSNAWYMRHYESYFDKVYMVYLRGSSHQPIVQGRTTLISLGSGRSKLDFLLAPLRLYHFAKQIKPTAYITSDQIWSWWVSWMIQAFLRARVHLMPLFMPEQIYQSSKQSVSIIFPIWLEHFLIRLSFLFANRILSGLCFGNIVAWVTSLPQSARKTIIVETLPDALPPPDFLSKGAALDDRREYAGSDEEFHLIYVGRLQRQKLVDDLVRMMAVIGAQNMHSSPVKLTLVGDGPERANLENLVDELGVRPFVTFAGQVSNEALPEYLSGAHVYVSPLTGTSLREAAHCGLPVVAYDMDWIHGLLKHEETALLVAPGDHQEMGQQVLRLREDKALRRHLSRNVKQLAEQLWSAKNLYESLRQVFEADSAKQRAISF